MSFRSLFGGRKRSSSRCRVALRGGPRRLVIEALEGREVPASLTLGDAMIMEGNTGAADVEVAVSLSEPSAKTDQSSSQTSSKHNASGWIADPVGDFLPTYTGPQDPGLDVTAHRVMITPQRVLFFGKMAGPIAATQEIGGLYIIGMDRGRGTARFLNGTPQIGPNVKWDLIVRINPDGTGLVNNQVAGVVTPLDPADITIDGNEFTASVPLSVLLPAATRPMAEWTYNLWPRNGLVPGQNQHVSDLAPDDGNSPVRTVPPRSPTAAQSLVDLALAGGNTLSDFDAILPDAFRGLNVAVERFGPAPPPIVPPNPVRVAPVFALNYDDSVDAVNIPRGQNVAMSRFTPVDPCRCLIVSPIFFGLSGGTVDDPVT